MTENHVTVRPFILGFIFLTGPLLATEPAWQPVDLTTRSYLAYEPEFHMPPTALGTIAEKEPAAAAALARFRGNSGPDVLAKWRKRYASADLFLTTTLRLAPDFHVMRVTGIEPQTGRSIGREWLPIRRDAEGDWSIAAFPMNRAFAILLASPPRRGGEITTERTGYQTTRPNTGMSRLGVSREGWSLAPKAFPPGRSELRKPEDTEDSLCVVEKSRIYVSATGFSLEINAGTSIPHEDAAPACGEEVAAILDSLTRKAVGEPTTIEVSPLLRCGPYLACRHRVGRTGEWAQLILERDKQGEWIPAKEAFLPPIVRGWRGTTEGVLHWDAVRETALAAPPKIKPRGFTK